MEDKLRAGQNYDAWLLWNVSDRCNLACTYCPRQQSFFRKIMHPLAALKRKVKKLSSVGILEGMRELDSRFKERIDKAAGIDTRALIKTLDKTNKTFLITFSGGGEPFLVPNLIETCVELTKKHYISFNTNLTSNKIREFCEKVDPQRVAIIHASLHIKELERTHLLDQFIDNFLLLKRRGFNIIAKEVAWPGLFEDVDKYKEFFLKKGIELTFGRFEGIYKGREYPSSYTDKELEVFGIKNDAGLEMSGSCKGKICNAGYNAAIVYRDGDVKLCGDIPEHLGNIYHEVKFKDRLIKCPADHCHCPLSAYNTYLYEKALKEGRSN